MTRKVFVQMYTTLDGIAELTDSPDDTPEASNEYWEAMWTPRWNDIDTILLGRRSYEKWAAFWPRRVDDDDEHMRAFARFSDRAEKVVFSRTLPSADWANSRIVRGPVGKEIPRLRAVPGKNMVVGGGPRLVQSVLAEDLADELYLAIAPSIVGRGKPLFRLTLDPDHDDDIVPWGAPDRHDFRLLEVRGLRSGTVFLHYALSPKPGPAAGRRASG